MQVELPRKGRAKELIEMAYAYSFPYVDPIDSAGMYLFSRRVPDLELYVGVSFHFGGKRHEYVSATVTLSPFVGDATRVAEHLVPGHDDRGDFFVGDSGMLEVVVDKAFRFADEVDRDESGDSFRKMRHEWAEAFRLAEDIEGQVDLGTELAVLRSENGRRLSDDERQNAIRKVYGSMLAVVPSMAHEGGAPFDEVAMMLVHALVREKARPRYFGVRSIHDDVQLDVLVTLLQDRMRFPMRDATEKEKWVLPRGLRYTA